MRLIDADALKEEVNKKKVVGRFNTIMLIDNAPTVEPTFGLFKEMLCSECEKRPQCEWIYGEDDCGQDGWFCSECGFFVPWYYQYYEKDIDFIRDYKVCPHCKAEMITYTGKDRDTKGGAEE